MSKQNDGGPAFPRPAVLTPSHVLVSPELDGMTLRDYFAAKALSGETPYNLHEYELRATWAYKTADAMLAAREAK